MEPITPCGLGELGKDEHMFIYGRRRRLYKGYV